MTAASSKLLLVGRSSSHFTRVARIFAVELGVAYDFQVVRDLTSLENADYGGNPALKMPSLITSRGSWFGALNVCRELHRMSNSGVRVTWPEDLVEPLASNAQELVVQGMATEVALIMNGATGASATETQSKPAKPLRSLLNTLSWLEQNLRSALAELPRDRAFSFLEVALFCFVLHLEFRNVLPIAQYPELSKFCQTFSKRASAVATPYRFDA